MTQRTLVLLKPDAVRRGLVGEIIGRIERKAGWSIARAGAAHPRRRHAGAALRRARRQAVLRAADGVHGLRPGRWRWSSRASASIEGVRALAGPTDPIAAAPGTIRGDFGTDRSGRTWSTPPTPRSPPSARSRSSSPTWADRGRPDFGPRRSPRVRRRRTVDIGGQFGICGGIPGTNTSDTASPLQVSAVCSADNDRGALTPGPAGAHTMEARLRTANGARSTHSFAP